MKLWMQPAEAVPPPYMVVYRNRLEVREKTVVEYVFSADERAQLFLNGQRLADGPERGDTAHWYCQSGRIELEPGRHCLTARVLCFGEFSAHAQVSIRHGFYFHDQSGIIGDNWEYQFVTGCEYREPFPDWGTYPRLEIGETYNWDILQGRGGVWKAVAHYPDARELHPPELPPMRYEETTAYHWEGDWIVFDDYVCVWPEMTFSGPGTITLRWAETPYKTPQFDPLHLKGDKGRRDGEFLIGQGYEITVPPTMVHWYDHWWKAGRYLEIKCEGGAKVESMKFHRTGYPAKFRYSTECSSPPLTRLLKMCQNTWSACAHETYMDCPYYEQLMYVGDARVEALAGYVMSRDTRLTVKSMRMFARSARPDGMILSRYPARIDQAIPSFSMIYLMMLHDFAFWQDQPETLAELLPAARRIVDYLCTHLKNGLLELPGWNFIDWVDSWDNGIPPGDCTLNLLFLLSLQKMAEIDPDYSADYRSHIQVLQKAVTDNYYNPERHLFADDFAHKHYSEHAQVIALQALPSRTLCEAFTHAGDLAPASIYFSFYYLEACYLNQLPEPFYRRLSKWFALEKQGLRTLPENFENPRSDCHAWSAHPLYHYFASILGIRPVSPGGKYWKIAPLYGGLDYASGSLPRSDGDIKVRWRRLKNGEYQLDYELPSSLAPGIPVCLS